MTDRKSISLVFFDLPTKTNQQTREYTRFRKYLKNNGYHLLQKSVYVKLIHDGRELTDEEDRVGNNAPAEGTVCIIPFSLASFKRSRFYGENTFDISFFSDDIIII